VTQFKKAYTKKRGAEQAQPAPHPVFWDHSASTAKLISHLKLAQEIDLPMAHYFTVEEANAALPVLELLVEKMLDLYQKIAAEQPSIVPAMQKAGGNGGNRSASQVGLWMAEMEALVQQVQALGVLIKDARIGLLDFPAWRNDREVYLCWRYGEKSVAYWHDIDAGYSGRQPL